MSTWYNRHRSVGPLVTYANLHYRYRQGNCSDGNLTIQSEGDVSEPASSTFEEMYDVVTPNFRSRMRAGEIINNPYVHTWDNWSKGSVGWSGNRPANCPTTPYADYDYTGMSFGALGSMLPIDQGVLDSLTTEIATACRANFNKSAVQGWVILGEVRETINLLRNPIGSLNKFVSKKRGISGTSLADAVASAWLTGRFGWRPFMHDIDDIMEASVERDNKRLTARAKGSGTSTASSSATVGDMSHAGCIQIRNVNYTYSVRCGILGEVETSAGYASGTRLRDIPSAVWELLPYSFVADWFLNIGNYFEAIIPGGNVRELANWTTTDIIGTQVETITPGQYSNYTNHPSASVVHNRFSRVKQRAPGLVSPGITLRTASIEKLISLRDWRVLDTIALLYSGGRRSHFRK